MSHEWNTEKFDSEAHVSKVLNELRDKRWLCRGQSRNYNQLVPSIDRKPHTTLSRLEKLNRERQSVDLFRESAKFFSHPGEQAALNSDNIALMVLRHYGVPTRLLDWSGLPHVAAYFAACDDDTEDGEIWSFDEPQYEEKGKQQWKKWPETTIDGSGEDDKFKAELTEFTPKEPLNWFVCAFYPVGFSRQNAQRGAYSFTARFGRDHAEAITGLPRRHLASPFIYYSREAQACVAAAPP